MPFTDERRFVPVGELRVVAREGATMPMVRGMAIVFNALSEDLGGFRERIVPDAIDRTFTEKIDVRALVDHDSAKVLGRLSAGTLRMKVTAKGLQVEVDPPETSYARDVIESIRRGDIDGMSFAFRTLTDDWRLEDGVPTRDVIDMRVREVSVVTWPAYVSTEVDVARRSLEAFQSRPPIYRPSLAMLRNRHRQLGMR